MFRSRRDPLKGSRDVYPATDQGNLVMKQRFDPGHLSDTIHDAWSAAWGDSALQNLGRRLEGYGVAAEHAARVVEQAWLFYSYEALPLLGERVPMGIATQDRERPLVWLYLPFRAADVSIPFRAEPRFQTLNGIFASRVEAPLADWVAMDLEPVVVSFRADLTDSRTVSRFAERVHEAARRKNMSFAGIFVDSLVAELETVMEQDAAAEWMITPNTLFSGRKPIEIVDDPLDQRLRDVIARAKFNVSAA